MSKCELLVFSQKGTRLKIFAVRSCMGDSAIFFIKQMMIKLFTWNCPIQSEVQTSLKPNKLKISLKIVHDWFKKTCDRARLISWFRTLLQSFRFNPKWGAIRTKWPSGSSRREDAPHCRHKHYKLKISPCYKNATLALYRWSFLSKWWIIPSSETFLNFIINITHW